MTYQIINFDSKFIEKQVDLIWEISDSWKYPFQTSYDSIKKTYYAEGFDPTTRFYAVEGDNLLGYVSSAVSKDAEKGDYGTLRFPLAKNNDEGIIKELFEKVEERFLELGITRIRVAVGEGMGNSLKLADKFGFKQVNTIFKRSRASVSDLNLSGNFDNIKEFTDDDIETVKEIFMKKMGMPEKQGEGFFQWAIGNKTRKEKNIINMTSWKITKENDRLTGFSYLHRSDHNPEMGWFAPIWTDDNSNVESIYDQFLTAHINKLGPHGMKTMQTYLPTNLLELEKVYNKLGFKFDATFSYEKNLS